MTTEHKLEPIAPKSWFDDKSNLDKLRLTRNPDKPLWNITIFFEIEGEEVYIEYATFERKDDILAYLKGISVARDCWHGQLTDTIEAYVMSADGERIWL